MSVDDIKLARQENLLTHQLEMTLLGEKIVGGLTPCGKEVWAVNDCLKPIWNSTVKDDRTRWFKTCAKIDPVHVFYFPSRNGFSPAIEAHVFVGMVKTSKTGKINKEKLKQVEEILTSYIEGNRDMIKTLGASAAAQTYGAAAGSSTGAASNGKERMEIATDAFEGLGIAPKGRCVPYQCSSFCQEKNFYIKGGCPTCNAYWKATGYRDSNVEIKKGRVVQSSDIDADLLARHYAEVRARNPTWKLQDGIPVPPNYNDLKSIDKTESGKRKLEWAKQPPAIENDLGWYPRVPPRSSTVLCTPYQCTDMCMKGMFSDIGCPTCKVFWNAIEALDPNRRTTNMSHDGLLRDENGRNYLTYDVYNVLWKVDDGIPVDIPYKRPSELDSHGTELQRRYPHWLQNEDNEPQIPKELLTEYHDALMLTKEPFDQGSMNDYCSRFSWPAPHIKSPFLAKYVLAFWPSKNAWLPGQIQGLCAVRKQYKVRFCRFGIHKSEWRWTSPEQIKLVVFAPEHSPGTKRDPSLVGKNVMAKAQGFGVGWMPGIIVEPPGPFENTLELPERVADIATDQKRYYVVFNDPDHEPGDPPSSNPAHHYSLHPYQFCVVLDETVPAPEGDPSLPYVHEQFVLREEDLGLIPVMVMDESIMCPGILDGKIHQGMLKGVVGDDGCVPVVLQGECEVLRVNSYCPVKRPPEISVDTQFDMSMMWASCFALWPMEDGSEEWTGAEVAGFVNKSYIVTRDKESKRMQTLDRSKVWIPLLTDATKSVWDADMKEAGAETDAAGELNYD